jgi:hypothetical protein
VNLLRAVRARVSSWRSASWDASGVSVNVGVPSPNATGVAPGGASRSTAVLSAARALPAATAAHGPAPHVSEGAGARG